LRALLEQAGLIALPLQIEPADLRCDCGDLILLRESGPLLLLSEADGYHLWDPAAPARPPRRLRRRDLPGAAGPWHALGVSPSLPAGDGPMLLLAPAGVPGDWPADRWQELPAWCRRPPGAAGCISR
jgi:hypothetical protein